MILLDTHVLVWYLGQPHLLSSPALSAIEQAVARRSVGVSSISIWEVGLLVKKGRLQLAVDVQEWVTACQGLNFLQFWPVDNAAALRSTQLPPVHADPADRLLVATAQLRGVPLVSKDSRLGAYPGVQILW